MNKIKINKVALNVLHSLHRIGFGDAILAGGAVRDAYLGAPTKDYDFFIRVPQMTISTVCEKLREELESENRPAGLDLSLKAFVDDYLPLSGPSNPIGGVYDLELIKCGIPLQFIFTKMDPLDYVREFFDVGLCKCYVTKMRSRSLRVHFTDDFLQDFKNKTLTVCAENITLEQYQHTMEDHIPRLRKKYPNYTVKVAQHLKNIKDDYDNIAVTKTIF